MEIHLIEFATVVAASYHNPTIMNPDFLANRGVIPSEWDWELSAPPITTPPFATVQYNGVITLNVEPGKFTVIDKSKGVSPGSSKIKEISKKYIQELEHVNYTAVGINFDIFVEINKADEFLKERFLKAGSWNSDDHKLEAVSMKFVYPLEGGRLSIAFGSATQSIILEEGGKKVLSGVLFKSNFHRDCTEESKLEDACTHLDNVGSDWSNCNNKISAIMESR